MMATLLNWIRVRINKITQSIAFYPAIIAVGFLFISWGMIEVDFSAWGKQLKQHLSWVSLKDASTARSIISTVAGAIISLTVFSFSMVMIVLNQAASQMSNRVLSSMIENRFQQFVLGCYIGTIVYALFLLSTIRDINSGVYIPALSIYVLILLTVIDIFLFIYFLDYVTQTVKYGTVIERVRQQTLKTMIKTFVAIIPGKPDWINMPLFELRAKESNYYQAFNQKKMLSLALTNNLFISILCRPGDFLLKGTVFMKVHSASIGSNPVWQKELASNVDFYRGQPIQLSADYGFHQLAEIAIKALSPGINDPATAVISLHALTDLLAFRLEMHPVQVLNDSEEIPRIFLQTSSFDDLFIKCIRPIWNYGKDDQYIQQELVSIIKQLQQMDSQKKHQILFSGFANDILTLHDK